jgi:hypothetical protein
MSASTEELIAINSLLIEREAEFARVHSMEAQISALLGAEYPFEPPEVTIPSTIKKKVGKAKRAPKQAALKLRRLGPGEVAYRITWIDKGQRVTNEVTELKAVAQPAGHAPAHSRNSELRIDRSRHPLPGRVARRCHPRNKRRAGFLRRNRTSPRRRSR